MQRISARFCWAIGKGPTISQSGGLRATTAMVAFKDTPAYTFSKHGAIGRRRRLFDRNQSNPRQTASPGGFSRGGWSSVSLSGHLHARSYSSLYASTLLRGRRARRAITDGVELPMPESSAEGGSDGSLFTLRRA
jgi:hypothetical protein